jgi:hypothetical protein
MLEVFAVKIVMKMLNLAGVHSVSEYVVFVIVTELGVDHEALS